ncbi:uncharacterized protein LOC110460747 [Mizuhopecten yessoensis]|uniref:Uncharacterized protein n=1 Tax=Mizuhopecten yessoensis TaxID=6573 RepID=A0A210Q1X8_MIZYE|nr:uncharacterized protein LOC110460747 [Mizuhopecten yessoensis]OWF42699.1 hypothetical protein KP79_PYT15778 [Mizuhopecten yessoensis]
MAAPIPDTPDQSTSKPTEENPDESNAFRFKDIWKIMPCSYYSMVYKDCIGWKTKYYYRYWDGVAQDDCAPMKKDQEMCEELATKDNVEAYEHLLKTEDTKRQKRLESVQKNDVWEYRTHAPMGWYTGMLTNSPATVGVVDDLKPTHPEHDKPYLSNHFERYSESYGGEDITHAKPKLWLKPLKESAEDSAYKCVIS